MADDSVVQTDGAEESVSHSEYDGGRPRYAYTYLVLIPGQGARVKTESHGRGFQLS